MLSLYFDEDSMDKALVNALKARGVDVLTSGEAGMIGCSDEAHLEFAASTGRVLYTFNRGDFYQLHTQYLAEGKIHAGIVLAKQQRYSIGQQMRQLLEILGTQSSEAMQNNVEFLKD